MKLGIGDEAPDFELVDQHWSKVRLSDLRGKWVLLYFIITLETQDGIAEIRTMQRHAVHFAELPVQIVGVSLSAIESHRKLTKTLPLDFPLLSDEDRNVVRRYGVWGRKKAAKGFKMGVKRTTFLIDEHGKIAHIYTQAGPLAHTAGILKDFKVLFEA